MNDRLLGSIVDIPKLFENDDYPAPENAMVQMIETRDKFSLRTAWWQPTHNLTFDGEARGTVCLFHGFSEYIEKYYEVINELRRRGFAVAMMDWRGHGMSQRSLRNRHKGHVRSFRSYQLDLEAFIEQLVQPNCPKPYYALAHSMGGHNIFRACVGVHGSLFQRIVLCAPMLYLAPPNLVGLHWFTGNKDSFNTKIISQKPTRLLSGLIKLLGFGRLYASGGKGDGVPFNGNRLTSDKKRFDRAQKLLSQYSELTIQGPTYSWLYAACNSIRLTATPAFADEINVPILVLTAGADQIVSTSAIEKITAQVRVSRHIVIPGAKHEILQERDDIRQQFWAAFDAYIPGTEASRGGKT